MAPAYQVCPSRKKIGYYDICTRAGHVMADGYPGAAAVEICGKLNRLAKTNDEAYRKQLLKQWKRDCGDVETE